MRTDTRPEGPPLGGPQRSFPALPGVPLTPQAETPAYPGLPGPWEGHRALHLEPSLPQKHCFHTQRLSSHLGALLGPCPEVRPVDLPLLQPLGTGSAEPGDSTDPRLTSHGSPDRHSTPGCVCPSQFPPRSLLKIYNQEIHRSGH